MKREAKISLAFLIILFLAIVIFIANTTATNSGSSSNANLTIWDDTDGAENRYSQMNVSFNANYTNSTGSLINSTNGNGNCAIRFNETGTWTSWSDMLYNTTSFLWQYNRSFNYKGVHIFQANCTSNFGNISISDNFTISNTVPSISRDQGGSYIDLDGNKYNNDYLNCYEDSLCTYNFSRNVTEIDINDILTYGYTTTTNTTLVNFTLNTSTSILEINVTLDTNAGNRQIELTVRDTESPTQSGILRVNITTVNDAPIFVGLQNFSFNISELFERIINVTDEENNIPFVLNISFLNCSTALWSTRNNTNCTLFNSSQYSFNSTSGVLNISFIPLRNDVGSYIINFSVMDNSSSGNKTTSQIVNFTVLNVNVAPYFRYVCDNERNTTEDFQFACWINATDIDETNNLTFTANYSWFKFNNTNNSIIVNWNISSDYNFSARVNFTPTDTEVGNWSVNVTLTDTGSPVRRNSTVFWFFINNTEDNVSLNMINNYTLYENRTIYVNATDDDLLVSQKNVKNEVLTFASNTSWVNISTYSAPSGVNYTTARIMIDYDTARSIGTGNYTVKVNVTDTAGNFAERIFTITIQSDTAAAWNISTVFVIYEHNLTYLNFSQNVTDAEGDSITFSFTNDTSFPSFGINATTGVINFTPVDDDVGQHIVTMNAYDGKLNSYKTFNFTVYNVNDLPYIETPLSATGASVNSTNSNINTTEDSAVTITLWIRDNDFRIPSGQKSFYNESLTINLIIQGPNTTLLGFIKQSGYPTESGPNANRSYYLATFTPRKSDVGSYNLTINVSDASNVSSVLQFNLTIDSINHAPVLMNLTNQTFAVNRSFYYRINATDIEDGNSTTAGNTNFTFIYNFTSGRNIFNGTIFNSTTGEINITFNSSHGGKYRINITVNDSVGATSSADFWLYVYDYPNVSFPELTYNFNLAENVTSNLTFIVNHSVQDNLTYEFYIKDSNNSEILKYNISYYGNATNLTWQFTPNFTEETYGSFRNLTLIVYPSNAQLENRTALNKTMRWNINISHTNAPVIFSGRISDYQTDYNNVITISLGDYFSDIDYSDNRYNQTVNFSISSNSTPSYIIKSISNWTLTLSSLIAVTELLTINASDSNSTNVMTSALSNTFEVKFITPTTTPTPTPSGGGGGATQPLLLKMVLPDPVSAYKKDRIVLPVTLINEGKIVLYGINLTSVIAKNNVLRRDVTLFFDKNYISSLQVNERKNVTLTVNVNTEEIGLYEITINASVKDPKYSDWGKIYLTIKEANKTEVLEKLLFTEEFIAENPECIEIKEILKEARRYFEAKDYTSALEKAREAVDACRAAIAQPALPRKKESTKNDLYKYLSISALVVFAIGIFYYFYKRVRLKGAQTS